MNMVRQTGAVVALILTFTISPLAGIIHSPGAVDPPPPPRKEESTSTTTTSTSITTEVILSIVSLIT